MLRVLITDNLSEGGLRVLKSCPEIEVVEKSKLTVEQLKAELQQAVAGAEADTVYVTHGFSRVMVRWLREQGVNAEELETRFVGDHAPEADGEPEGQA